MNEWMDIVEEGSDLCKWMDGLGYNLLLSQLSPWVVLLRPTMLKLYHPTLPSPVQLCVSIIASVVRDIEN